MTDVRSESSLHPDSDVDLHVQDGGASPRALLDHAIQRLLHPTLLLLSQAGNQRSNGGSGGRQHIPKMHPGLDLYTVVDRLHADIF